MQIDNKLFDDSPFIVPAKFTSAYQLPDVLQDKIVKIFGARLSEEATSVDLEIAAAVAAFDSLGEKDQLTVRFLHNFINHVFSRVESLSSSGIQTLSSKVWQELFRIIEIVQVGTLAKDQSSLLDPVKRQRRLKVI